MLRREDSTGVENLPELVISSCRFNERISIRIGSLLVRLL